MAKKQTEMRSTRKERRKRFSKWTDMGFLHRQRGDSAPIHGMGDPKTPICDICGEPAHIATYKNGLWSCDRCKNKVCDCCGRRARLYLVHPDKDCKQYWCQECIDQEEQMFKKLTYEM